MISSLPVSSPADIERELRELFRDKAGEAPVSTLGTSGPAPQRVLRRGRRCQVGSSSGPRSLPWWWRGDLRGAPFAPAERIGSVPDRSYEVFERTATIEAFTVTGPSDWYLVNEWPLSMQMAVGSSGSSGECTADPSGNETCEQTGETTEPLPLPYGLPMIQLSNIDTGLASIACRDGLPDGAAVLYVALDYGRAIEGIADPSAGPWPGSTTEEAGACGPGSYTRFTVNGEPFFSWIGFGDGVTEDDRSSLLATYESLTVDDGWEPVPPNAVTPAYVIAGGSDGTNGPWRLELRRDANAEGDAVDLSLEDGPAPTRLLTDGTAGPLTWTGTDPIFGVVAKEATGIEFRPGTENESYDLGGSPVPGTILPVPSAMGSFDFDIFFIDLPADYGELGGHVIALGVEPTTGESPPPVAAPRGDEVEFAGDAFGQRYRVRFTGAFADDSACIHVTIGAQGNEPLCPKPLATSLAGTQPSMHGVTTTKLNLLVGSVLPTSSRSGSRAMTGRIRRRSSSVRWDRSAGPSRTGRCARCRCRPMGPGRSRTSAPTGACSSRKGWAGDPPRQRQSHRCRWIPSTGGPTGRCTRGSAPQVTAKRTT